MLKGKQPQLPQHQNLTLKHL